MKFGFGKSMDRREERDRQAQADLQAALARGKPPTEAERTWVLPVPDTPSFAPPRPPARPAGARRPRLVWDEPDDTGEGIEEGVGEGMGEKDTGEGIGKNVPPAAPPPPARRTPPRKAAPSTRAGAPRPAAKRQPPRNAAADSPKSPPAKRPRRPPK
jgi:hypothetical protein